MPHPRRLALVVKNAIIPPVWYEFGRLAEEVNFDSAYLPWRCGNAMHSLTSEAALRSITIVAHLYMAELLPEQHTVVKQTSPGEAAEFFFLGQASHRSNPSFNFTVCYVPFTFLLGRPPPPRAFVSTYGGMGSGDCS